MTQQGRKKRRRKKRRRPKEASVQEWYEQASPAERAAFEDEFEHLDFFWAPDPPINRKEPTGQDLKERRLFAERYRKEVLDQLKCRPPGVGVGDDQPTLQWGEAGAESQRAHAGDAPPVSNILKRLVAADFGALSWNEIGRLKLRPRRPPHRPKKITPEQERAVQEFMGQRGSTIAAAARHVGISRSSVRLIVGNPVKQKVKPARGYFSPPDAVSSTSF